MSVGWDVKLCPLSRTTPLARKRPFNQISMKSRLVRATRELKNFTNDHHRNSRRRYMAETLPILRKTQCNQSINLIKISPFISLSVCFCLSRATKTNGERDERANFNQIVNQCTLMYRRPDDKSKHQFAKYGVN